MIFKKIKFGIITTTYNRPLLLERAINSVLGQTYVNWVQVVVNDCSDISYDYLATVYDDKRIIFLKNKNNSGVNYSRNKALEILEQEGCDFITFLDDDDYLSSADVFKEMIEDISKKPFIDWFIYEIKNIGSFNIEPQQCEFDLDYINDYLYGNKLKGDKHHLIRASMANGKRFTEFVKNGYEWTYFIQFSNLNTRYVSRSVKCIEYQEDGLTKNGQPKKVKNIILQTALPTLVWMSRPNNLKALKRMIALWLKFPLRLGLALFR